MYCQLALLPQLSYLALHICSSDMSRPYQQRARAHQTSRTKQRILDAALTLFAERGVTATTIAAIAAESGLQRLTVYRHFPDDDSLLDGCAARWWSMHPLPADRWSTVNDPRQRVRVALEAVYDYFAAAEPIVTRVSSERSRHPALGRWLEPHERFLGRIRDHLADGWGLSGRPQSWLDALLTHTLDVHTWASLVRRAGLAPADAARLMARSVADLARDPYA